jgi:hypothetical protein
VNREGHTALRKLAAAAVAAERRHADFQGASAHPSVAFARLRVLQESRRLDRSLTRRAGGQSE